MAVFDDDQVQRNYEARWARVLGVIQAAIDDGERDLSRLVNRVHRSVQGGVAAGPAVYSIFGVAPESRSLAVERVGRAFRADTLIDHADGVDLIVELGSGWGYNLFNVWLRGGPSVPYLALEFVPSGRQACDLVAASVISAPSIVSGPFDARRPRLPETGAKHALVFSSAALDKVRLVSDDLIGAITRMAERVTVIHFEQIPWQLADHGVEADAVQLRKAEKQGLNLNLYSLIITAAAEGRISLDEVRPSILDTPDCMLRWSAARAT